MTGRRAATPAPRPYRVRFDEAGPDGLLRTSVLLRYAQDLAWYHSAGRGFGRDWYAERGHHLARPRRRGRGRRPGPRRRGAGRDDPGRRLAAGLGAAPDRVPSMPAARSSPGPHRLGAARCARRADADPARVRRGLRRAAGRRSSSARVDPGSSTGRRERRAILTVRPQELDPMDHVNNAVYADWLDERSSRPAACPTSGRSRGWSGSSTRAPRSPARRSRRRRGGRPMDPGRAGSPTASARTCCGRASSLVPGRSRPRVPRCGLGRSRRVGPRP